MIFLPLVSLSLPVVLSPGFSPEFVVFPFAHYWLGKMKTTALTLVATLMFVLASSATATYPTGSWISPAHATFYGDDDGYDGNMGGACGYGDANTLQYLGLHTAALSDVLFQGGQRCGACFELQCVDDGEGINWCLGPGASVIVTATNNCPLGSYGGWCDAPRQHFDLSVPAFTTIAQKVGGVVPIQFRRVPCQKQGGIRFLIKGNPYFQQVLIYNVAGAGDIQSVSIKGENTAWLPTKRSWGENWQFGGDLLGQALSFCVTTSDDTAVVSYNVANNYWGYGMTFEGAQFS